ncbi:DUF1003 domain-containing protein [Rothia santali]|uniref:DUF1003 domain-containing protein n=1 Tax=Rothia santali TaxID=2949643 RepID=UPI002815DE45|nr:DUF1003 domain-containing protein [Rothia santali]
MSDARRNQRAPRLPQRFAALDTPLEARPKWYRRYRPNPEAFGVATESFARWMGTPQFLLWMTVFVTVWLLWNTMLPESLQFDPRALNFTLLTLMLSLQASYAAPLLLLAQNRQDDRDRVVAEEDRKRAQQNLADTEYLTREIVSLRIALREVATRDFVRSEIRDLLEEILEEGRDREDQRPGQRQGQRPGQDGSSRRRQGAGPEPRTSIMDIVQAEAQGAGAERNEAPHGRARAEQTNDQTPHPRRDEERDDR